MPFQSKAQSRWAFTKSGQKALGGESKVKEWAGATDYAKLPDKAPSTQGALSRAAKNRGMNG
jgi:hypothetical protein